MQPKQILAMAVQKEVEAEALYREFADKIKDPGGKTLLTDLAREEAQHKEILEGTDPAHVAQFRPPQGHDMMITEFLESKPLDASSSLQEVLVFAMKREQMARQFYETMAGAVDSPELQEVLRKLAQMETAHKARLEALYEDVFLADN